MSSGLRWRFVLVLAALWAVSSAVTWAQAPRQNQAQKHTRLTAAQGKQIFTSTCAGCHGLDGRGAERAPNIADRPQVQRLSDAQISNIVSNGIPGTGMPPFHSLQPSDLEAIVGYLRILQGNKQTLKLPGDPDQGETAFFGKAGCSHCHMVRGKGGFIASDLSTYASTHEVEQIRSAITTQNQGTHQQARLVTATTRGGEKVVGRIRNEDNFSMQLETLEGKFFSLPKSDLTGLEYSSDALMPSDYSSKLSPTDLNNIISYLMREAGVTKAVAEKEPFDEE